MLMLSCSWREEDLLNLLKFNFPLFQILFWLAVSFVYHILKNVLPNMCLSTQLTAKAEQIGRPRCPYVQVLGNFESF